MYVCEHLVVLTGVLKIVHYFKVLLETMLHIVIPHEPRRYSSFIFLVLLAHSSRSVRLYCRQERLPAEVLDNASLTFIIPPSKQGQSNYNNSTIKYLL